MSEQETAVLSTPGKCDDRRIVYYHTSLFAGHQCLIKTYLTMNNKSFIPGLIHHLRSYIKGCHFSQLDRNKKPQLDNSNKELI